MSSQGAPLGSCNSSGASGTSVTKRLQKELMSLMTDGIAGVSAFPTPETMFEWVGTLNGKINSLP